MCLYIFTCNVCLVAINLFTRGVPEMSAHLVSIFFIVFVFGIIFFPIRKLKRSTKSWKESGQIPEPITPVTPMAAPLSKKPSLLQGDIPENATLEELRGQVRTTNVDA